MSFKEQVGALQELIPLLRERIGSEIDKNTLQASPSDMLRLKAWLNKDAFRQTEAVDVWLGFREETSDKNLFKIFRMLDAMIQATKIPGYFKVVPAIDAVGPRLLNRAWELASEWITPQDIVSKK